MKPNFALDLSHDGINLLHRSKGGWHLVGSVALDDPDVGGRLEELHRSAAMLESSGITTKIIIPDSQILYTTVDAPGPDDIAREVQIRTALDGLTPYPVGELVFDWRAQGDKARVAVLARETMDEAEGFAAQYMFNPVSFVARPGRGVFSGEPFFGKSRASAKILPPGERIEPDATPVPHNPGAATLPESAGVLPPDAPEAEPPLAENAPGAVPEPTTAPLPDATMAQPTATTTPAVEDDPFAELDQIAAELSGDEITAPAQAPRPKPSGKRKSGTQSVTPPQLAPFPPTPDEIDEAPMSVPHPVAPRLAAGPPVAPPANPSQPASAPRPMSAPGPDPSPSPDAVPFSSTRKSDPGAAGTPRTPTTRLSGLAPRIGVPEETTQAPTVSPSTGPVTPPAAPPVTPTPSPQGSSGTVPTAKMPPLHGDRLRAEMAEALAKPLPRAGEQSTKRAQKGPGALARLGAAARGAMAARAERRAQQKSEAAEAALAQTQPAPKPATSDDRGARKGLLRRRSAPTKADQKRDAEAEALTVFGARKGQTQPDRPKYLGLILTLVLLILMAAVALWSGYVVDDGKTALFNPGPDVTTTPTTNPAAQGTAPTNAPETTTATPPPATSTAQVLSPEAAEAHYAATGIWERAPDNPSEPGGTRLDNPQVASLGEGVQDRAPAPLPNSDPSATRDIALADPVPPPPPGTVFDLDANGLVVPTPDGALSPTGVLVFAGRPARVPPAPPANLFPQTTPQATATPAAPAAETATTAQAPGLSPPLALPGVPSTRPAARPQVIPDVPAPVTTPPASTPETPTAPSPEDNAAIDAAVEGAVLAAFEDASELAVAASRQPAPRPASFAKIVSAAQARASDGSQVAAAVATTTPAIPTSANVATRATTKNALNLRRINLIGIYGSSSSRRALVRLDNGRYVKVEVGDRLDGGKVTSISASQLTYQKGRKAIKLEVLPLG